MNRSIDALLATCARCSKEELERISLEICNQIDEERAAGNKAREALFRDMCRVIDGIGDLRFSRWWPSNSPARKRDRAALAFKLAGNTRAVC